MIGRCIRITGRLAQPAWGLLALVLAGSAFGQTMLGPDPYRPYNSGYESFSLPPSPMQNYSAINQLRSQSYSSRANQMSQFYDELYSVPGAPGENLPPRLVGPGIPYTRANRQYDEQWGRVYTPNPKDAEFYNDRRERTRAYFEAMKETDPKKRAAKLRAVEEANLRAARELGARPHMPPLRAQRTRTPQTTAPASSTPGTVGRRRGLPNPGAPGTTARPPATRALAPALPTTRSPLAEPNPRMAPVPGAGLLPPRPSSNIPAPSATARPRQETPSQILDRALRDSTEPAVPEPLPPTTPGTSRPPR